MCWPWFDLFSLVYQWMLCLMHGLELYGKACAQPRIVFMLLDPALCLMHVARIEGNAAILRIVCDYYKLVTNYYCALLT